jgi:hypothetical protein
MGCTVSKVDAGDARAVFRGPDLCQREFDIVSMNPSVSSNPLSPLPKASYASSASLDVREKGMMGPWDDHDASDGATNTSFRASAATLRDSFSLSRDALSPVASAVRGSSSVSSRSVSSRKSVRFSNHNIIVAPEVQRRDGTDATFVASPAHTRRVSRGVSTLSADEIQTLIN